jgi:hypothetical protein
VPADRWSDERLDDFKAVTDRRLDRLEASVDVLSLLPGKLDEVIADAHDCRSGQKALQAAFEARAAERAKERIAALEQAEQAARAREAERKKDRRWQVTTLLAVAALILTGVGILLSALP